MGYHKSVQVELERHLLGKLQKLHTLNGQMKAIMDASKERIDWLKMGNMHREAGFENIKQAVVSASDILTDMNATMIELGKSVTTVNICLIGSPDQIAMTGKVADYMGESLGVISEATMAAAEVNTVLQHFCKELEISGLPEK